MNIGQVCIKIAGRDAGQKCVIVELLDKTHVLIDGETRRRKCNMAHLELLDQTVSIGKGATHAQVAAALGIKARVAKVRKTPKVEQKKAAAPSAKPVAAKPAAPVKKATAPKKTA